MPKTKLYIGAMPLLWQDLKSLLENESCISDKLNTLKGHRALSYGSGRALLKYALLKDGILSKDSLLPNISYSDLGKPKLDGNKAAFNLSHSNNLMALSLGSNAQGVDIEFCNEARLRKTLLQRVLSLRELELLQALKSTYEQALFFTRQWTLRESLLKVMGHSVFSMDRLLIDPDNKTIKVAGYPQGIIATFKINMRKYLAVNDKILHLHGTDSASCDLLINDQARLNIKENQSFTKGPNRSEYLDYFEQVDKGLNDFAACFQVSVFLELCYQSYDTLEHAVSDNLEIWSHQVVDSHNDRVENCEVFEPFQEIKCVPQAIFKVN